MVIVETLKDTLTLEAMKLTDSENRLKQTELHLQGEMNRVSTVYKFHTYINNYSVSICCSRIIFMFYIHILHTYIHTCIRKSFFS